MPTDRPRLVILVFDRDHEDIGESTVTLEVDGAVTRLDYNRLLRRHEYQGDYRGTAVLRVEAAGFESQTRPVVIRQNAASETFYLGRPGDRYTYFEGRKHPYVSFPCEIGLFRRLSTLGDVEALLPLLEDESAVFTSPELDQVGHDGFSTMTVLLSMKSRHTSQPTEEECARAVSACLARLRGAGYQASGPIFRASGGEFSIFTNRVDIGFVPRTAPSAVDAVLARYGLRRISKPDPLEFRFPVEADPATGEELNDIIGLLLAEPDVAIASAVIVSLKSPHAFPEPTNFLWPSLWDRKLAGVLEAWQQLNTAFGERKAHGDPNIVIAIVDDGIKSTNGIPDHEDFKGNVTFSATATLTQAFTPDVVEIKLQGAVAVTNQYKIEFKNGLEGAREVTSVSTSGTGNAAVTTVGVKGVLGTYDPPSTVTFTKPGEADVDATLVDLVEPMPSTLHVDSVANFAVGQAIVVGEEGDAHSDTEIVIILEISSDPNDLWIKTTPLLNTHSSSPSTPVVFGRKLYTYVDFDPQSSTEGLKRNNDDTVFNSVTHSSTSNHGLSTAGVAAAKADTVVDGRPTGIVGTAPNARLMGILRPGSGGMYVSDYDIFPWIAGTIKYEHGTDQLPPLPHGADIINYSVGGDDPNRDTVDAMMSRIVRRGRNGRGTLIFISAGNDHVPVHAADWSATYGVFIVAASAMWYDENTQKAYEHYASYSNFSNPAIPNGLGLIDLCAPSGDGGDSETSPPLSHNVITADFLGKGNMPGSAVVKEQLGSTNSDRRKNTNLSGDYSAGETKIVVNDSSVLAANKFIRIGGVGNDDVDWIQIDSISTTGNIITLKTPLQYDHISKNVEIDIQGTIDSTSPSPIVDRFVMNIPVQIQANRWSELKPMGLIRVNVGGTDVPRRMVSITFLGSGKLDITVDAAYVTSPTVNDAVVFPRNRNTNSAVILETTIEVEHNANYDENRWILVGDPGPSKSQAVFVGSRIGTSTDLRVSGLIDRIPTPTHVIQGPNDYYDHFSGTSSAAPLTSGIAALVLSAKPTLTWLEVEDILKSTAAKIDPGVGYHHHTADLGADDFRWKDTEGRPVVGIQGDFVDKSRSTTISSSPTFPSGCSEYAQATAGNGQLTVANNSNLQKGAALSLTQSASPFDHERVIIKDIVNCIVKLESALKHTYPAGCAAISGKTTATGTTGTNTIQVASAESFVVGQEIRVAVTVSGSTSNRRFTIADLPVSGTDIVINETLPGTIASGADVIGGRLESFYVTGIKSELDGPVIPPNKFKVDHDDIWYFDQGNLVMINRGNSKSQSVYVQSVDTETNEITVCNADGTPVELSTDHASGDDVVTGWTEVSSTSSEGADTITVDAPDLFVEGQAIRIDNDVYTVIVKIDGNTLHVRPRLTKQVGSGDDVVSGRKPYRSGIYGAGRMDAERAVERALAYTHDQRDLMIRSFAGDLGTGAVDYATQPLVSPDIWIQLVDAGAPPKLPAQYAEAVASDSLALMEAAYETTANLHDATPIPVDKDAYVYARIRNRGTDYDGLRSRVRFYLYQTLANPPFRCSQTWDDARTLVVMGSQPGTYLINTDTVNSVEVERVIELFDNDGGDGMPALNPDAGGHGRGGIKPGHHYIVRTVLPHDKLPSAPSTRFRSFIVVEITPHDGVVTDAGGNVVIPDRVGHDNNIAMREISFASTQIKNADPGGSGEIPTKVKPNKSKRVPKSQSFRIEMRDPIGSFMVQDLVIGARREQVITTGVESYDITWDGSGWTLPGVDWISLETPTMGGTSTPIDPEQPQTSIDILGELTFNDEDAAFQFDVALNGVVDPDHAGYEIMRITRRVEVEAGGADYHDLIVDRPPVPNLHVFADMTKVEQSADSSFGPKSESLFRTTSGFTVKQGFGDASIYAAATGLIMIQHIVGPDGQSFDQEYVNVVIKPLYRSAVDFTPVKYFVYRRLRLTDFIAGPDPSDEILLRPRANAADFIAELYADQDALVQAYIARYGDDPQDPQRPAAVPSSDILGWDRARTNMPLDQVFTAWSNGTDGMLQLPIVKMGTCLGTLSEGAPFGFEIVLEGGVYHPDLDFARLSEYVIDLDAEGLTGEAELLRREHVLSFVDPAAYLGIHTDIGIYHTPDQQSMTVVKGDDVYSGLLAPFATKNTIYVDIRSENGYSLNYYGNYTQTDEQQATGELKLASGDVVAAAVPYGTARWPVHLVSREVAQPDVLYFSLPNETNPRPALYLEHGEPFSRMSGGRFRAEGLLATAGETWTKKLGVNVLQAEGATPGTKEDVASVMKMHYARLATEAWPWTGPSPVPEVKRYHDNLFGPIDQVTALDPWKTGTSIKSKWVNLNELRFLEIPDADPALRYYSIVERGVAIHDEQLVFFNSALDFMQTGADAGPMPVAKGADAGFSPRASFAGSSPLFEGLEMEMVVFRDTTLGDSSEYDVTATRLKTKDGVALPKGLTMVGLSVTQFGTLVTAAGSLSDKHERNIVLKPSPVDGSSITVGGVTFNRYTVEVRGLHATTLTSQDEAPASTVYVYTLDGLLFVPAAFAMPKIDAQEYRISHEEIVADSNTRVDEILQINTTIDQAISDYASQIGLIHLADADAKDQLIAATQTAAAAILDSARSFTIATPGDERQDDRQLYWARLRMSLLLHRHEFVKASTQDEPAIATELEEVSRGYRGITFGAGLKILVVGFDPFDRDPSTAFPQSNPSGVVALALHGTSITHPTDNSKTGTVQAVIVPVRYADFDAGLIERFFEDYLYASAVDMIVTISQNGTKPYFDIERFAARVRSGSDDNNDEPGELIVGRNDGTWKELYETNLPVHEMMSGVTLGDPGQNVFFNQTILAKDDQGQTVQRAHPKKGGPNMDDVDASVLIDSIVTVDTGSGGAFLPNEIFYRIARLRETPPQDGHPKSTVLTGHLQIPAPQYAGGMTMKQIVEKATEIIARGLAGLP